jgi:hypothetical protein
LPDGLFSNQKSQFGKIFQGLRLENVYTFYGQLNIVWVFGIFCDHSEHIVLIWYSFPVSVSCTKKNLATLLTAANLFSLSVAGLLRFPRSDPTVGVQLSRMRKLRRHRIIMPIRASGTQKSSQTK